VSVFLFYTVLKNKIPEVNIVYLPQSSESQTQTQTQTRTRKEVTGQVSPESTRSQGNCFVT